MKKIGITFLAVILALPMLLQAPLSASAATAISIYIDGARLSTDQAPVAVQGRVLLPLRAIFEGLGSTVDWNQSKQTVTATKGNTTVVLKMKSRTATINNQTVSLDVPAQAIGGRTMVPVRFVSEALGATVNWNSSARSVTIFSGSGGTDTSSLKAAQYVTLRDVANTGDGRDLQVSFSRSTTESLVDHYRLLIVKASNASAFNLTAALKVGSANYTTVQPNNTDQAVTLSSSARDVDGALIQSNQAYVGYVLTVGKGTYGSALSTASNSLTLDTGISVSAVTNVRINDVSDYADGRDAAVTFTRASNESNISEYRVFLVKTKDASSFSLSRANSLSNQYYTTVSKTSSSGSTLTGTFSASSRDTAGDLIKNNVAYTAFVLSVSNTSLASNKLSTASPSVTLAAGTVAAPVITLVQDITDYGDGRDLRVSFTKIADESKISGYRIFVVKANDYSNFTLARANAVSSSNYKEVSKTGYNQSEILSSNARDVDGATIRNGVNYRVFVMAVGSGAYTGSNALSYASNLITLMNNYSVGAVSNLYASDVNDYNDGRDLFVSFKRASDESNISHYRIMVVKAANANSFTLAKAINVSGSNYIQASVGRDFSDVLPSGARDVDGAKIQTGVSYRVFVLSVGRGSYTGEYTLSESSSTVVLTNNFSVGTVSGLTAADIGDYGDGRDLQVQFYRATEESNISQYRVYVVKASKTLTTAQAIDNRYYETVSKSGSTNPLTAAFGYSSRDTDGDTIQNNTAYRVYVLSLGSGSYAGSNALSNPASITLTDSSLVQAVTNVTAITDTSTGQASDIKVSFTKPANETNIDHYRILVVPAEQVNNFNLSSANNVMAGNYTPVAATGNNVSNQPVQSQDAFGATIEANKTYQVFVLSVGKSGYTSALSAPTAQFKISPAPVEPAETETNGGATSPDNV
ncbi:copper amine oxidase N-terminal domain-containing protein [Paenibacillus antibioticophila]|uniref:copper amine oxidase N-terminal domain-containing protein n=1 Tax=Paenibacillus antibioticophila TaxID=1274374 RepID=UPI000677B57F|nr:copper amine oxidase N-terminal domain-containing protein [Paenibacillus antibioticophila]